MVHTVQGGAAGIARQRVGFQQGGLQSGGTPEAAADGCFSFHADVALHRGAAQQRRQIGLRIGVAAAPIQHHGFEGTFPQLAVDGGGFDAIEIQHQAIREVPLHLGLPGEGQQFVGGHIGAEGERKAQGAAVAVARCLQQLAGLLGVVFGPRGHGAAGQAGRHQRPQRTAQPVAHPFTDLASVEADGQGPPEVGVLERFPVAQQGDVADLHRRTHRLVQLPRAGPFMQGVALVFVDRGGEQQIHLATAQCPVERRGVAQRDQIEAVVARRLTPVLGKGLQALLMFAEAGQFVGACPHKAVVQKTVLMVAVGRW